MNINKRRFGAVPLILLLALSGCMGAEPREAPSAGKIRVVATIYPLYEFAREVGKDRADVTQMIPPGVEAHTYEPKPSDIVRVSESDVLVINGAGLEKWARDMIAEAGNERLRVVDSSLHANLLPASGDGPQAQAPGGSDPHIWLDFQNDQMIVDAIADAMSGADPPNRDYYIANADAYKSKLENLDASYAEDLRSCENREYITGGHRAFGYLDRRYNLTELAAYGTSPDSEPSPRRIRALADIAREHRLGYVYVERLVSPKAGEALAAEVDAKTLILDPGHNIAPSQLNTGEDFISIMRVNLVNLRIGLVCA